MNYFRAKEEYIKRYKQFLHRWEMDKSDKDSHGHAMELSYVLIDLFGMTEQEMRDIEKGEEYEY